MATTRPDGSLCPDGYYGLYERRLLPVLRHVDADAAARNTSALLTIPGLGCGQFGGPFRGQLGAALQAVLERLLTTHGASLPNIRAVYYDPQRSAYLPPPPFRTWEEVVKSKGLRLRP